MNKGFTLIELIVVIAIIAVLYGIILFSVTLYINKGKDSNIYGNLSILIPAGEAYYNGFPNAYGGSSTNFCSLSLVTTAFSQMSSGATPLCAVNTYNSNYQSWVACANEFTNTSYVYCVDSRGMSESENSQTCATITSACATSSICQCP
jgi:prepilin-type N-terminal cleavage/methylation domain-containing protein